MRFPILCAVMAAAAAAAATAAATAAADDGGGLRCAAIAPQPLALALQPGKASVLRLPEAVAGRSVGNPAVAQALLAGPDALYVAGVDIGSTNMIVQGRSGKCIMVDVTVSLDTAALQAALARLLPAEKDIRVGAAADALVLSGTVADAPTMMRVLDLAQAYVRRAAVPVRDPAAAGREPPAAQEAMERSLASPSVRLVNLLAVVAPQQVMLEVKVAEVARSLIDTLEGGAALRYAGGGWAASVAANFLSGYLGGSAQVAKGGHNRLELDAETKDSLVRILAEPTLMALSGQEGSFLAGGKIMIPVAQDDRKVTLEEKEFGIGLRFTPTVLAGGRIHLKVAPEVSELSREGVGITVAGFSGTAVLPLITTRRASTTVQLGDGQSFAIGGLLRNNQSTSVKNLPLLGELPILGALFRSTDFQHDRTELLFVVTPHLVQPLPSAPALPTGAMAIPGRAATMLGAHPTGESR